MNFIKNHKLLIGFIAAVLLFVLVVVIFLVSLSGTKKVDEYGNRLDGIEKVGVKKETIKKLEKEIKAMDEVTDCSYRLQGRLINVKITFKKDTELDSAKEIGNQVLEYFDDEEKTFYDIQIFIKSKDYKKNKDTGEITGFNKIGYKHKTSEGINWD